jgi:3-hydroxyisobutyrate dehydrogenase-like beta-hydroxyacid dehydrogenase
MPVFLRCRAGGATVTGFSQIARRPRHPASLATMAAAEQERDLDNSRKPVVGIAGCGSMGLPMAQALQQSGFEVWGFDVKPAAAFGDFRARMLEDPAEFARRAEVVISVVRDAAQTRELCFERQALFAGTRHPRTLVISSTLSPRLIPELRGRLPSGVTLIDAPMSGAPLAARERRLSFMLGGPDAALDELEPLFRAMGRHLFRLGPLGAGMTAKVLNNYVAATSTVAVRRVYARARALGADLGALRQVMAASSGSTWFGDRFEEIDWAREGYAADNTIGILEKDVLSGLDALDEAQPAGRDGFDDALLAALRAMEPCKP